LLKIKTFRAQQARQDLMTIVNLRLAKEKNIEERSEYLDSLMKAKKGKTPAANLQADYYHKDFVKNEIKKLENDRVQLLEIENVKRQKLTEAMKEEKILEKLKDKQKQVYMADLNKDETEELNEIALRKFYIEDISNR